MAARIALTLALAEVAEERLAAEPDGAVAVVSPGEKYSNCMVDLEVGKHYLVFADRGRDDARLYTNRCRPTGELARVADALAYCRHAAR